MEVIPAIDLRGGQCVRLYQGDYAQETVFDADPLAVAARWAALGAPRIHVVDLDGAREGRPVHRDVIARIAAAVPCPVQVGGGIRDLATARAYLDGGLARVVLGTAAITDRALLGDVLALGPERVVISVDARDGFVRTAGWTAGSDVATQTLIADLVAMGVVRIVYTEIARDGTDRGPDVDAYRTLTAAHRIAVIAAGGVSSLADLTALAGCGVEAAIVGRALYTGAIALPEALTLTASGGGAWARGT